MIKMKLLILFVSIFLVQSAFAADLKVPKTCEDVLAAETCDKFRDIAKKLHEKVGTVNEAIIAAYNHHKTRVIEVTSFVKEYLVTRATNFKCENVLTADQCAKIKDIATKLHLTATQASLAVKEAVVNGANKITAIYNQALVYMRDRLSTLTCASVLTQANCDKLTALAGKIHIKASEVNRAIRESIIEGASNVKDMYAKAMAFLETEITCINVLGDKACATLMKAVLKFHENVNTINVAIKAALEKHLTKAADILNYVRNAVVENAKNFKCESVLTTEQCDQIKDMAARLKLKASETQKVVKEAIVAGAEQAKQIYARAVGFLLNDVKNVKCEDLIKAETCAQIKAYAKKIHAKTSDVLLSVKEAIIEGAKNAKDTLTKAKEFLKAKISCENVMSKSTCDKIRSWADKFSVSLTSVNEVLREAISNGVTKVTDLYNAAIKFIMDKWTDNFGDEIIVKRGITDAIDAIRAKIKALVRSLAEKILDATSGVTVQMKNTILKIIEKGEYRLSQIRQIVTDLVGKLTSAGTNDEALSVYRRSIIDDLKEALKKAKADAKEWIKKALEKSAAELEKLKEKIREYLGKHVPQDVVEQDLAVLDEMVQGAGDIAFDEILANTEEQLTSFDDEE